MRNLLLSTLAAVTLVAGMALAQTPASVTYYGTACGAHGVKPPGIQFHPKYPPKLGTTTYIMFTGDTRIFSQLDVQPLLITGLTKVDVPWPKGLTYFGDILQDQPAGCRIYVSPDLLIPLRFGIINPLDYDTYVDLYIPNKPSLAGFTFYCQYGAIHRRNHGQDVMAVTLGPRAEITVGH